MNIPPQILQEFDKEKIFIGIPVPGTFGNFTSAYWAVKLATLIKPKRTYFAVDDTVPLTRARNGLVREFLDSDASYMLFIDADNTPPPDGLLKLWMLRHKYDVITGLYCMRKKGTKHRPCVFRDFEWFEDKGMVRYSHLGHWNGPHTQVAGIGLGFALIPRYVFEKIEPPYFHWTTDKTEGFKKQGDEEYLNVGEDLYFSWQVRKAGFTMGVDTTCQVGHLTQDREITLEDYYENVDRGLFIGEGFAPIAIHNANQEEIVNELKEYTKQSKIDILNKINSASVNLGNNFIQKPTSNVWKFLAESETGIYDNIGQYIFNIPLASKVNKLVNDSRGRVLIYGGGVGEVAIKLAKRGIKDITHYDYHGPVADFAMWRYKKRNVDVKMKFIGEDKLTGKFDTIYCLETLQYVENPVEHLKKIAKLIKPNSKLHLSAEHEKGPFRPFANKINLGTIIHQAGLA